MKVGLGAAAVLCGCVLAGLGLVGGTVCEGQDMEFMEKL